MKFSIIIPNYNSEKWIEKLLKTIEGQTFTDYEVIVVDDMSTDKSVKIVENYVDKFKGDIKIIQLDEKRWNGGTRNVGVRYAKGDYIIFADCDDWFNSNKCLEEISNVIDTNNEPDLVRLPYHFIEIGEGDVLLCEGSLEELAKTVFVAPWTKCVKRELFVPFPENTLIEDIVQHIAQIDTIENFALCPIPIMVWNRRNREAISATGRKYTGESKRFSSIYRNTADLIDLKCKHDYCEARRKERLAIYLDVIHNAKEDTLVERG